MLGMSTLKAVGIVTDDLDQSLEFYRLLGLEPDPYEPGADHVDAQAGSIRVMWDTSSLISALHPGWTRPTGGHAMAMAFECDSPAEVDELHDLAVTAGFTSIHEPWDAFWGQRYATVNDPDGNPVDLFAAL